MTTDPQAEQKTLAKTNAEQSEINRKARELVTRLRFMLVNGNKLTDPEIFALAQYAAANDLDPFAGECYMLPNVGPIPGIAGWRRKAYEQLLFEAKEAGRPFAEILTHFEVVEPADALFDPKKGDQAIRCVVKDTLSSHFWRRDLIDMMNALQAAGVEDRYQEALKLVGPEPQWSAVAVVYGSEKFAKEGAPEKYARSERVQKRAERLALRKRFTRLHLPEPEGYADAVDALDVSISNAPPPSLNEGEKRSPEEISRELTGENPPPLTPEELQFESILDGLAEEFNEHKQRIVNTLKYCKLPNSASYDQFEHWLTIYRQHRLAGDPVEHAADKTNQEMGL